MPTKKVTTYNCVPQRLVSRRLCVICCAGHGAVGLLQTQKNPTGVRLDVGFAALPRLSKLLSYLLSSQPLRLDHTLNGLKKSMLLNSILMNYGQASDTIKALLNLLLSHSHANEFRYFYESFWFHI